MSEKIVHTFLKLLLARDVKDSVLSMLKESALIGNEKKTQEIYFCACMDNFLEVQASEELKNQLQVVIDYIKTT